VADQAAAIFYQRLFEIDPSARALFRTTDMAKQRKNLIQILSVAVSSLDNLGALGKTVMDAQWGGGISKNPYLAIKAHAKAGDKVVIAWEDNKGEKETAETTVG